MSPVFCNKAAHVHTLKYYAIHVARSLLISGIMVLSLWLFAKIPFTREHQQPGERRYYNAYAVAIGFAAFTVRRVAA